MKTVLQYALQAVCSILLHRLARLLYRGRETRYIFVESKKSDREKTVADILHIYCADEYCRRVAIP